jgi:endoglucanase
LAGVIEDVQLAIDAGLAVIVDFHWYQEMMDAANNYTNDPVNNAAAYDAEKTHFI